LISKTGEYALRAVLHLAREGGKVPLRANEIAERLDVPANYLSKTLHLLARAGVLHSARGPRGGFRLARPPAEVTLADVLEPLDPELLKKSCLLGLPQCSDESSCPLHERWRLLREPVVSFFRETTLADVSESGGGPEEFRIPLDRLPDAV
jgi:Rrf2 family protein